MPPIEPTASRALLHTVAKLHYESDLAQVDIAKRLGLSAATISRLLQRARAEGIVRIEVRDLAAPEDLSRQLCERLGLRQAAVVDAPPAGGPEALAGAVGDMLRRAQLRTGSVLAIGWGRAVRAVVEAGLPEMPGVVTVPATGGMQQEAAHFQVNEFVRLAAERAGGRPAFVHAPYLPSLALREVFLADPQIGDGVALWDRADAAIVGIGLPRLPGSTYASASTPGEQALAEAEGDVIRHYFDAAGAGVAWEGEARMIAMSRAQLQRTPLVIGVASGEAKAAAIRGAARARLVSALATDTRTALAILDLN